MPFNFETFDKRSGRLVKAPEVTIQRGGTVSLNAAAAHLIGDAPAVEILFDKEQQVVGIRPVEEQAPHCYPMRPVGKERGTFIIACRAFFVYYGLPVEVPTRRDVHVEDGILILDLKDPGRVAISNRNRRQVESKDTPTGDPGPNVPGGIPTSFVQRGAGGFVRVANR